MWVKVKSMAYLFDISVFLILSLVFFSVFCCFYKSMYKSYQNPCLTTLSEKNLIFTCWSTPTASSPSYMMLTQPSLHDSTNRDIRAWRQKHRHVKKCCLAKKCYHLLRKKICLKQVTVTHHMFPNLFHLIRTWIKLSKLYFRRIQR